MEDEIETESENKNIELIFDSFEDEYGEFDKIDNPPFSRPDLCAFVFLDKLFSSKQKMDIVSSAEHDEIWLDIDGEQIEQLTKEQILYLVRCGVRYDADNDSLVLFV
jgi:hypothetical protein